MVEPFDTVEDDAQHTLSSKKRHSFLNSAARSAPVTHRQ
jgi:hypothetical protein